MHERRLGAAPERVGALIDSLSSDHDALWPTQLWPAMYFDRELGVGARGGHGPMRYHVSAYRPGELVEFACDNPPGVSGHHRFELERDGAGVTLRHVLDVQVRWFMRLGWWLVIRPLHDAVIGDALDRAQTATGQRPPPRRWPLWVRALRIPMRLLRLDRRPRRAPVRVALTTAR